MNGDRLAESAPEELSLLVVEGCREMAVVYAETEDEWREASEETWRGIE